MVTLPAVLVFPGCQRNNCSTIQDFHLHSDKGYLGNLVPPISHYGESYEAEIKFCSRWLWGEGRWKAVHSNDPVGKCVFLHVCVCAVASACTSAFLFKAAFLCVLKCFVFLLYALVGLYYTLEVLCAFMTETHRPANKLKAPSSALRAAICQLWWPPECYLLT